MEKNEDIKEAKEELNQLSKDETLRRIALKEELLRMDINQAKTDAEEYGREKGAKEKEKTIIKKLYSHQAIQFLIIFIYMNNYLL